MAANPPDGAVIDYLPRSAATGPVTLEFLDSPGALLRCSKSDDLPEPGAEELGKQLVPPY